MLDLCSCMLPAGLLFREGTSGLELGSRHGTFFDLTCIDTQRSEVAESTAMVSSAPARAIGPHVRAVRIAPMEQQFVAWVASSYLQHDGYRGGLALMEQIFVPWVASSDLQHVGS